MQKILSIKSIIYKIKGEIIFVLIILPLTITAATINSPTQDPSEDATYEVRYCPEIATLQKDPTTMMWSSGSRWKSYTESFANQVSGFIGAQWLGIKVGKIICLYTSKETFDFPIALEPIRAMLVPEPQGSNWSANVNKKGFKFCSSANIQDCSFMVQIPKPEGSPYEAIKYQPQNNQE